MPCKHAVGAIWNIVENGLEPGIPKSWVHLSYWLATWEEMYRFKINPCNGPDLWPPLDSPITYTPPEYHKPAVRPSKKRKKSAAKLFDGLVKNDKLGRFGQTITFCKCGKKGHNSRTCKGQRGATSVPTVNQTQTTQTTVNPYAPAVNLSQTTINSPSQTSPTMRYIKQKASRYGSGCYGSVVVRGRMHLWSVQGGSFTSSNIIVSGNMINLEKLEQLQWKYDKLGRKRGGKKGRKKVT
nr:hypothetical protein [Tanacetum cinerariifolium]